MSIPNNLSSRTSTQASPNKAVISHNPLETGFVIITRQSLGSFVLVSQNAYNNKMKVTTTLEGEQIFNLDVSDELELENFKALLEFESGVQSSQIVIFHNGIALRDDKKTLNGYGIKDGDVLLMRRRVLNAQPLPPSTGNIWHKICRISGSYTSFSLSQFSNYLSCGAAC